MRAETISQKIKRVVKKNRELQYLLACLGIIIVILAILSSIPPRMPNSTPVNVTEAEEARYDNAATALLNYFVTELSYNATALLTETLVAVSIFEAYTRIKSKNLTIKLFFAGVEGVLVGFVIIYTIIRLLAFGVETVAFLHDINAPLQIGNQTPLQQWQNAGDSVLSKYSAVWYLINPPKYPWHSFFFYVAASCFVFLVFHWLASQIDEQPPKQTLTPKEQPPPPSEESK